MSKESYVDEYRPESLSEIVGHGTKIDKIRKWGENWKQGRKPLLLYGPAGTGKTTTAEAVANDMDWSFVEINASSARTTDDVVLIAQEIRTLTQESQILFLLDEVDSYEWSVDLSPLLKVLKDAPQPVIATCNEKWKVPNGLENACKAYKFTLKKDDIKPVINRIADEKDIDISLREIGMLGTRTGLRDAINDLQEYAESGGDIDWDERETDIGNFKAIDNLLRGKRYSGEMTPPDVVTWLDENLSSEFAGVEAMRAYQCLSEADRWLGRVDETQDYSWWRYAGSIAEQAAEMRLTEPQDWIHKSYPKSLRNPQKHADDDQLVTQLFNELKSSDIPGYKASCNYSEFVTVIFPLLKDLPEEERMQISLSESLSERAMRALNITESQFNDWLMEEKEDEEPKQSTLGGDFAQESENSDAGNGGNEQPQSLFDF